MSSRFFFGKKENDPIPFFAVTMVRKKEKVVPPLHNINIKGSLGYVTMVGVSLRTICLIVFACFTRKFINDTRPSAPTPPTKDSRRGPLSATHQEGR